MRLSRDTQGTVYAMARQGWLAEGGRFIANQKFEDGDWWPVAAIEPHRARVERWYALTYGKKTD